ncbi:MAG: hypothetical protein AAFN93_12480, partial [Bacteroidota bacterium]
KAGNKSSKMSFFMKNRNSINRKIRYLIDNEVLINQTVSVLYHQTSHLNLPIRFILGFSGLQGKFLF